MISFQLAYLLASMSEIHILQLGGFDYYQAQA